jgi:hypothetical protein
MILMPAPTVDEFAAIWARYSSLNTRLGLITQHRAQLLAHYTSVATIEQILRTNTIWLSNPLNMNDLQEMRTGISLGLQKFAAAAIKAGPTPARTNRLIDSFTHYLGHFDTTTALDTYIFCLSKHAPGDTDGLLSMWREYGSRGNGAALVINLQKINFVQTSPLIIADVTYADNNERERQLEAHLDAWVAITQALNLPDDQLHLAAYAAFIFIRLVALTTKHCGFLEEREVRVISVPEQDPNGYLAPCLDYHVGPRGVEPKLKYKFGVTYPPTRGALSAEQLQAGPLVNLLEFILLGPTGSSILSQRSFIRMLEKNNLHAFADRVYPSSIPLRPT